MDLTNIYRTFHQITTFFSSTPGTFSTTDHSWEHKSGLTKFLKIEITAYLFSNYKGIKLEQYEIKSYIKIEWDAAK